jgi:hypothetical protein
MRLPALLRHERQQRETKRGHFSVQGGAAAPARSTVRLFAHKVER